MVLRPARTAEAVQLPGQGRSQVQLGNEGTEVALRLDRTAEAVQLPDKGVPKCNLGTRGREPVGPTTAACRGDSMTTRSCVAGVGQPWVFPAAGNGRSRQNNAGPGLRYSPYRQISNSCLYSGLPLVSVRFMTLGEKLKSIRRDCGLSQEAIGAQGFISTPGWIKLENSQRSPSEKLLHKLVGWLVEDKYIRASASKGLVEELLTLKYLASSSKFVRDLAHGHAKQLPNGAALLAATPSSQKPKLGRPRLAIAR